MRYVLFFLMGLHCCFAIAQNCTQIIPVILLNEQTRAFEPAIALERLHANIGGAQLPIVSAAPLTNFRLLILMDASGSMEGEATGPNRILWSHAIAAIDGSMNELFENLPNGVTVEYGAFNKEAAFGPEFTRNAVELKSVMAGLRAQMKQVKNKSTSLYDALHQSIARFQAVQPGDSILVITDENDNHSRLIAKKVEEEAVKKGIRLFSIVMKEEEAQASLESGDLPDFVEHTGGSMHVINMSTLAWMSEDRSIAEKKKLRRFLQNEILSGYLLRVNPPNGIKQQSKWRLSVDRLPKQKYKIVAQYPSRLNGCTLAAER